MPPKKHPLNLSSRVEADSFYANRYADPTINRDSILALNGVANLTPEWKNDARNPSQLFTGNEVTPGLVLPITKLAGNHRYRPELKRIFGATNNGLNGDQRQAALDLINVTARRLLAMSPRTEANSFYARRYRELPNRDSSLALSGLVALTPGGGGEMQEIRSSCSLTVAARSGRRRRTG